MADERLSSVNLTILNEIQTSSSSFPKYTVWFDIDNTLYSKNCRIHDHMTEKIKEYFKTLGLPDKKADELHIKYYKEYGLAIRGLVRNHDIDPLDYDQKCDSAIPLEKLMKPDETVRKLLLDIDRSKARVWCLTNAYKTHALRVLKILNLIDLIDAVVSCDYTNRNFHCKPEPEFFEEAIEALSKTVLKAVITGKGDQDEKKVEEFRSILNDRSNHLLVDDSHLNIIGATKFGFGSRVFFDEKQETDEPKKISNNGNWNGKDKEVTRNHQEQENLRLIKKNNSLLLRGSDEVEGKDKEKDYKSYRFDTICDLNQLREVEVWRDLFKKQ